MTTHFDDGSDRLDRVMRKIDAIADSLRPIPDILNAKRIPDSSPDDEDEIRRRKTEHAEMQRKDGESVIEWERRRERIMLGRLSVKEVQEYWEAKAQLAQLEKERADMEIVKRQPYAPAEIIDVRPVGEGSPFYEVTIKYGAHPKAPVCEGGAIVLQSVECRQLLTQKPNADGTTNLGPCPMLAGTKGTLRAFPIDAGLRITWRFFADPTQSA